VTPRRFGNGSHTRWRWRYERDDNEALASVRRASDDPTRFIRTERVLSVVAEGRRSDRGARRPIRDDRRGARPRHRRRDVLVGSQSTVEFGLRGRNVALGERVSVENDIEAEGDCRLDTWCSVDGNVLVGEDAYLGERVTVTGRLMVSGDLDIGDDVTIEEGSRRTGGSSSATPSPPSSSTSSSSLSSCGSARPTRPTTWRRRSPTAKTCVTPAGPA